MENLNSFIYMLETSNKSKLTIGAYRDNLLQFYDIMSIKDESVLKDYTLDDFIDYLNILKKRYAPSSINQKLATLQVYYDFLIPIGMAKFNHPRAIDKLGGVEKLPQFLEIEESKKLVETTLRLDTGKDINLRDRLIIQIFLDSGVRAIEMERMKISHIDFKTRNVYVLGKRNKERFVKFHQNTLNLVNEWLKLRERLRICEGYEDYLFISTVGTGTGTNLKKRAIQYIVEKFVKNTDGIPQISTHKLRHTYATTMLSTETLTIKELQDRLGHKYEKTTKIYAHALREKSESNPLFN